MIRIGAKCSYCIYMCIRSYVSKVAKGNLTAAHARGSGGMPPRKILNFNSPEIAF